MWLWLAILSGFIFTAVGLVTRHVLRQKKDAWAFSFYYSAIGALTALPFFILHPKVADDQGPWMIMLLVGLLIVVQNFLNFKSSNILSASIQGSIMKFRLIWVFLIGLLFLQESFTFLKLGGTLLTVLAGIVILAKFKKTDSMKGVGLAFSSTIAYAIVIGLYKLLFSSFNSQSLTFFIFLIPAVLNLIIMPDRFHRIIRIAKENGRGVLLACVLGGFGNLVMNTALSIGEASKVLVIIEAFLILTLVGEHIVLKERDHLPIKIIAVLMATVGAICIRLS